MPETKEIEITGTNNRYQIKKVTAQRESGKKRASTSKWNLSKECYTTSAQLIFLRELASNECEKTRAHDIILAQIETKLSGYKHQDILKKINNEDKLIKSSEILQKLVDSELKCFYCKGETHVLYEIVREMAQWTLDRIDNNLGHFTDNVVIACLECNLKRRKQNSDKFLFTKQMNIVRTDF